jgi:uncharacterized protein (TIGR02757 family)
MAGWNNRDEPQALKEFLDEKSAYYDSAFFIETDPIQVPHQFSEPEDIEIAGFLTAILAWGRKATIVASARRMLSMMPGGPFHFLSCMEEDDLEIFLPFVHRTFNGIDCIYFLKSIRRISLDFGGLGRVFQDQYERTGSLKQAAVEFRRIFFMCEPPGRTSKHLPDIAGNSAGKRLNMFLRWMVRRDGKGVDFGIWDRIPMSTLFIPLDVHTGSVARKLGLLHRRQNDWKAVEELTGRLREMDPNDPVRYDYALFGLGSFEGF